MPEVKLVKFKFKPNSKLVWINWCEELKRRKEEVFITLKNEGVLSESCFISEDGEFVYYFMEAEDFEKAKKVVNENPHQIDIDHKNNRKSSLELVSSLENLLHFNNSKIL
jgi:hypothetical protein